MLTDRDISVLLVLVRYYVLNRQQIQQLVFPGDPSGRVTRRRLQMLVADHLINRRGVLVAHNNQAAAPVYFPARKGCEFLAEHFDDPQFLATPTQAPIDHHTLHWLAVSDTHIAFDAATKESAAKIRNWINEWDVINKDETAPEKKFRLYSLLRDSPRLVCAPDSGFLFCVEDQQRVFYLEQDRATSGVTQIAHSKTPGYAMLAELKAHRRHFPTTTFDDFSVLMVAPSPKRRDALRRAIADKPGAALWRFLCTDDLAPNRLLTEPVFYTCDSDTPRAALRK